MIKIALCGSPGSGKSTTAAHAFVLMKQKYINVDYVHEYVREEINKGWKPNHMAEQFRILKHQREREDTLPENLEFMITDSPLFLIYYYAIVNTEKPCEDRFTLVSLYEDFIQDLQRYDYIFFMVRDKPYVVDGTRYQTEAEADAIHVQLKALLDLHKIDYTEVRGNSDAAEFILDLVGV